MHDNPLDLPDGLPALTSSSGALAETDASPLGRSALISPSGALTFTSALALYSPSISAPFGFPKQDNPFDLPEGLPVLTSNSGALAETDASPVGRSALISPSGALAFTSALVLYSPSISALFGFPKHDNPFD